MVNRHYYDAGYHPTNLSGESSRRLPGDGRYSGISGRTTSSGVVDPGLLSNWRSTVSSQRSQAPSSTSHGTIGGVGEFPIPKSLRRNRSQENTSSAMGFLSIEGTKQLASRGASAVYRRFSRSGASSSRSSGVTTRLPHRRSVSSGSGRLLLGEKSRFDTVTSQKFQHHTGRDLYTMSAFLPSSDPYSSPETPTRSYHPYAYVYSDTSVLSPSISRSTPPGPRIHVTDDGSPTTSQNTRRARLPSQPKPSGSGVQFLQGLRRLKNSVSSPDLRLQTKPVGRKLSKRPRSPPLRPKDRWLSPETWCDALLFPRPRLKLKIGADFSQHHRRGSNTSGLSGRIVSPPESPLKYNYRSDETSGPSFQSKVLVHSRSLADFSAAGPSNHLRSPGRGSRRPMEGPHSGLRHGNTSEEQSTRPRSFSLGDRAALPPVTAAAQALEEKQVLDDERRQWRTQATHSFQNKYTRSLSRTRSKSLTRKGRKEDPSPSSIEFLAARAYLGNQVIAPTITIRSSSDASSKSSSKLFKAKSQGHLRQDSWASNAFKPANRHHPSRSQGSMEKSSVFGMIEQALKMGDAKQVNFVDPGLILAKNRSNEVTNSPPSTSDASDSRIGIAIGSPPPDELAKIKLDSARMSMHPYAQGGQYLYSRHRRPRRNNENENEEDPTESNIGGSTEQPTSPHPYSQTSLSRDSYIADEDIVIFPREDSSVPPPAKLWASWIPGTVREILPREIVYSPLMELDFAQALGEDSSKRQRATANDVGGVIGQVDDSSSAAGSAMNENYAILADPPSQGPSRQPVQYDATRPSYLPPAAKPADLSVLGTAGTTLSHEALPTQHLPLNILQTQSFPSKESSNQRDDSDSPDSPSPLHSPRPFDNPDSLDNFEDLFYRSPTRPQSSPRRESEVTMSKYPMTLPGSMRSRAGSGLSGLVRQLSENLGEAAATERGEDSSNLKMGTTDASGSRSLRRRGTESTLDFVFEEPLSIGREELIMSPPTLSPFHASLPEDVESWRASSIIAADVEDDTAGYRVGIVEPFLTPPAVAGEHRSSYVGQTLFDIDQEQHPPEQFRRQDFSNSNSSTLRPGIMSQLLPSIGRTQSSYTTSSNGSRISGVLSDFPCPPIARNRMTRLSSGFDEERSTNYLRALTKQDQTPQTHPPVSSDQFNPDSQNTQVT